MSCCIACKSITLSQSQVTTVTPLIVTPQLASPLILLFVVSNGMGSSQVSSDHLSRWFFPSEFKRPSILCAVVLDSVLWTLFSFFQLRACSSKHGRSWGPERRLDSHHAWSMEILSHMRNEQTASINVLFFRILIYKPTKSIYSTNQ